MRLMTVTTDQEVALAARRFRARLRWYMESYPDKAGTQAQVSRETGLTDAAVSLLLNERNERAPALRTMLAIRALMGGSYSLDSLLFSDPPKRLR